MLDAAQNKLAKGTCTRTRVYGRSLCASWLVLAGQGIGVESDRDGQDTAGWCTASSVCLIRCEGAGAAGAAHGVDGKRDRPHG